ncbi:hypothetical protein GQ43DRAFT_113475 [Delitschia confertaspora ATCC 74209]|uniref:Uncharacterized protein n=1 Tax=Delitschia confertaspora ATCC 74209 TaxID=1513339 RepID=A0A9P4JHI9_9PLEO|nr:hypothetical protein GQ43DRAFT_113475 [Delitschia confertaspora ATCC 74209]
MYASAYAHHDLSYLSLLLHTQEIYASNKTHTIAYPQLFSITHHGIKNHPLPFSSVGLLDFTKRLRSPSSPAHTLAHTPTLPPAPPAPVPANPLMSPAARPPAPKVKGC